MTALAREALKKLVDLGPITDAAEMPPDEVVAELVGDGVAEVIRGATRSVLRATFAGRKQRAEWCEPSPVHPRVIRRS